MVCHMLAGRVLRATALRSRNKLDAAARALHRGALPPPIAEGHRLAVCRTLGVALAHTARPPIFSKRKMSTLLTGPVTSGREWEFVKQWTGGGWNCYWGEDAAATYAFKPDIQVVGTGLVTFPAAGAISDAVQAAAEQLLAMYTELSRDDTRCDVYGSETDYPYVPVIIPWAASDPLDPAALLKAIGAHKHIQDRVNVVSPEKQNWGVEQRDDGGPQPLFEQHGPAVRRLLTQRGEPAVFYAGSEQLNPVPFFVLAQLDDSFAGGFFSALVHT